METYVFDIGYEDYYLSIIQHPRFIVELVDKESIDSRKLSTDYNTCISLLHKYYDITLTVFIRKKGKIQSLVDIYTKNLTDDVNNLIRHAKKKLKISTTQKLIVYNEPNFYERNIWTFGVMLDGKFIIFPADINTFNYIDCPFIETNCYNPSKINNMDVYYGKCIDSRGFYDGFKISFDTRHYHNNYYFSDKYSSMDIIDLLNEYISSVKLKQLIDHENYDKYCDLLNLVLDVRDTIRYLHILNTRNKKHNTKSTHMRVSSKMLYEHMWGSDYGIQDASSSKIMDAYNEYYESEIYY